MPSTYRADAPDAPDRPVPDTDPKTAKGLYAKLETAREDFLQMARWCAALTQPHLFPPKGHSPGSALPQPNQDVGARGVNILAGKLLLALVPPTTPFFKFELDDRTKTDLEAQGGADGLATILEGLTDYERDIVKHIGLDGDRVIIGEGLKQVEVGGNVLFHLPLTGPAEAYTLNNYVVRRDGSGTLTDIIAVRCISFATAPADVRDAVMRTRRNHAEKLPEEIDLYTHVCRKTPERWEVYQEVNEVRLEDRDGWYPADDLPWIAIRWSAMPGEDYGRGHVETIYSSLLDLDDLSLALNVAAKAAAKVIFLTKPGSLTRPEDLVKTPSGGFASGQQDDVHALQVEKQSDLKGAATRAEYLTGRLDQAFLNNIGTRRSGERVTAEEIRWVREELESAFGSTFTTLASEFQSQFLRVKQAQLRKRGVLPRLPKKAVRSVVNSGFDAMGRNADLASLMDVVGTVKDLGGPRGIERYMHVPELFRVVASLRGVEYKRLLKSTDEITQADNQAHQQAMMQAATGPAVNALGRVAAGGIAPPAPQPTADAGGAPEPQQQQPFQSTPA